MQKEKHLAIVLIWNYLNNTQALALYPNNLKNWFLTASAAIAFEPASIAQLIQVVLLPRRLRLPQMQGAFLPNSQFFKLFGYMVSFEAGIMGALFAMMIEDPINNVTKAKEEAQSIFNAWHKESQISLLKQIIVEDGEGYDPSALTKALGRFDACEQTAQRFWDFLVSKGITPWKEGAALKYVLQKNDTFLRLMAKNIKGEKEVHILWNHCPIFKKHYITEIFYKNGISFPSTQSTFISITCKIPSGNRLFIRGSGNGLNWENGSPLTRCNDSIWIYVSPVPLEDMEYKFFINDKIGHEGDNHKIIDGKIDGRSPHFILPPNLGTSLKTHGKS